MFDADTKKVNIKQPDGKAIDAATGAAIDAIPDSASAVSLNNRLRRAVDAAFGGLTLMSPDLSARLSAARSAVKSHDEALLPTVEAALAKETNRSVKQTLSEARAAILLFKSDAGEADKLGAVATIKARGAQDALALLTEISGGDQPASVSKAAAGAIASIQSSLAVWSGVQNAGYGLSLGSVLLLAAIGLAITFGVMGVIIMAHGEMVMLGSYATYVLQGLVRSYAPGLADYSLAFAVPAAFLFTGLVGVIVERGLLRWLYGRPLEP